MTGTSKSYFDLSLPHSHIAYCGRESEREEVKQNGRYPIAEKCSLI